MDMKWSARWLTPREKLLKIFSEYTLCELLEHQNHGTGIYIFQPVKEQTYILSLRRVDPVCGSRLSNLLICSSVGGHFGSSQFGAMTKLWVFRYKSLDLDFVFPRWISVSGMAWSYSSCILDFLRNYPDFSRMIVPFYPCGQWMRVAVHRHQHLVWSVLVVLDILIGVLCYLIVILFCIP